MIRILHAADLHLDSPFAALAPDQAAQRREEQRQLVRRLAEECVRRNCQLLLLAGDLFDSDRVYRETAELLCEVLGSIRTRVFIAPGNHDPWSPVSPYATLPWPENVHIFRSRTVEAVQLEDPELTVYGAAFTGAHTEGLLKEFRAEENGLPQIMVIHGVLGDPASPYNPIDPEEVGPPGWTIWPWATSTKAICKASAKPPSSIPAAPWAGASTRPAPRAPSTPSWTRPAAG